MARVQADMSMFIDWALDTLIIALQVNEMEESTPESYKICARQAKDQLQVIINQVKKINDPHQPFCRQVALRVIRSAAARINAGTPSDSQVF